MIKILAVNDIGDMGVPYIEAFKGMEYEVKNLVSFYHTDNNNIDDIIEWCDLVLYCGGDDLSTLLYRESNTESYDPDTKRDLFEIGIYNKARKLDKYQVGICRGFQFLAVMNGDKLEQHNPNHINTKHKITYKDKSYQVNSYHHQVVKVTGYEIEWGPLTSKEFGVQWHPELGGESRELFQIMVKDFIRYNQD